MALALSRLGRRIWSPSLGDDRRGRLVRDWLEASGVEVATDAESVMRTSTAIADLDASKSATYTFDIAWRLPDVPRRAAAVVHTGSVAHSCGRVPTTSRTSSRLCVRRASSRTTRTCGQRSSTTPTRRLRRRVERFVRLADVVKASAEDIAWLYPDAAPGRVAERWRLLGPALVVVTDGEAGSFARHGRGEVRISAVPTASPTPSARATRSCALITVFSIREDPRWEGCESACGASSATTSRRSSSGRPGPPPSSCHGRGRIRHGQENSSHCARIRTDPPGNLTCSICPTRGYGTSGSPMTARRTTCSSSMRRVRSTTQRGATTVRRSATPCPPTSSRGPACRRRTRARRRPRVRRTGDLDRLGGESRRRHVVHVLHGQPPRRGRQERPARRHRDIARPHDVERRPPSTR